MSYYDIPEALKQQVRDFVDGISDPKLLSCLDSLVHCMKRDDWDSAIEALGVLVVIQKDSNTDREFPGLMELEILKYLGHYVGNPLGEVPLVNFYDEDGTVHQLPLFMKRPTEADEVRKWLNDSGKRVGEE